MSQETLKMLEKAREQLAATASSLETLVMDLVTSRLRMMDNLSPSSVLELTQRLHTPLLNGPSNKNRDQRSGILHIVRDP